MSVSSLENEISTCGAAADGDVPRIAPSRGPRARPFVRSLIVLADFFSVVMAFAAAWYLRYEAKLFRDVEPFNMVPFEEYLSQALILGVLVILIFFLRGPYRQQSAFWLSDFVSIFIRVGFAVMLLVAFVTFVRDPASSRLTYIYVWILATLFISLGRLVARFVTGQLHRAGFGTESVLVVGENTLGRMVMQGIASQPHRGLQIVGFLAEGPSEDFGRFAYLGPVDSVGTVLSNGQIDQVIVALPSASHETQLRIVEICQRAGVRFHLVPDLFEMSLSQIDLSTVYGVPLMELRQTAIEGLNLGVKRILDLTLCVLLLIPTSVVMAIAVVLVKLDSPGPLIFSQTRVGKGGKQFTIYKFRSMRLNAEAELDQLRALNEVDGHIFKIRSDPRLTRVGRWLRRASIDELPQLFNVLKGEMSLVGPRPPLPTEVAKYEDWHLRRLTVAPGVTGLWQVSGRSRLNFEEMVVFDLTYIQNWSLMLDLSILARTLPAVVKGALIRDGGAF